MKLLRQGLTPLLALGLLFSAAGFPLVVLILLSSGTGWTWPHLFPDRVDFAPWAYLLGGQRGLTSALVTSLAAATCVCLISTPAGLLLSRALSGSRGTGVLRFLVYLPFVLSPVVVGVCLYDLFARIELAGGFPGVVIAQSLFATAFAGVIFSEFWNPGLEAREQLVSSLGGGRWARWRHALWPEARGLIAVAALQTALFSWLDFGLAAFLGGGRVPTLTVTLFALIREGSVNLAALAGLLLMAPAIAGLVVPAVIVQLVSRRDRPSEAQ
ncbi:MAG: ABC transporter permease [Opitutales bacterium]